MEEIKALPELERYRRLVWLFDDAVFEAELESDTVHFSDPYQNIFSEEEHVIPNFRDFVAAGDFIYPEDREAFLEEYEAQRRGEKKMSSDFRVHMADGDYRWCRMVSTPLIGENKQPVALLGKFINVDSKKRETDALIRMTQLDSLTQILNRSHIEKETTEYLDSLISGRNAALLVIDIDDFKGVNDAQGHLHGDEVLKSFAQILRNSFRRMDLIGRLGGDEFAVLMKDISSVDIVKEKIGMICDQLSKLCGVTISIGVTMIDSDCRSFDAVYQQADQALYYAKNSGKNGYAVYHSQMGRPTYTNARAVQEVRSSKCRPKRVTKEDVLDMALTRLDASESNKEVISELLSLLGNSIKGSSRAYILGFSSDSYEADICNEWAGEGILPLGSSPEGDYRDHLSYFDEEGMYVCGDTSLLEKHHAEWCRKNQIGASCKYLMIRGTKEIGVLVVAVESKYVWTQDEIDIVKSIGRLLTLPLLEIRQKEKRLL